MSGINLLILLLAVPAAARVDFGLDVRENLLYNAAPPLRGPGLPSGPYWLSGTFVRPGLTASAGGWSFQGAVEASLIANSADIGGLGSARAGGSVFARGSPLEGVDLTLDPVRRDDKSLRLRVERLKLSRSLGPVDADLGRQPVSLGTSRFVGVVDVVAPFPPGDLDAAYKPGVDAVRLRTGLGAEGEAEFIGVGASPRRDGAAVFRARRPLGPADAELLGGRFRKRHFAGAAWEGDLDPVAFWGESAVFEFAGGPRFAGIGGIEFKPAKDATAGAAYFYQEWGAARAGELASAALQAPYREGWAFLGSRQYALLTASAKPHPLLRADLSAIVNLTDASSLWQPRLTLNAADEIDVSLYGWWGFGRGPGPASLRSEFGSAPDGAGVYTRVFF